MKIELLIDGQERIFTTNFISGRFFRKVMEFDESIDYSDISVKETDKLIGFICDVFDNQFTVDEFYDGIASNEVISTISDTFVFIRTGKTAEELTEDKDDELGK